MIAHSLHSINQNTRTHTNKGWSDGEKAQDRSKICIYVEMHVFISFFFLAGRPERRGGIPTKREKNIRKHVRHHIPRKPYGTRQQAKMTDNLETEKSEKALLLFFFFLKKKKETKDR